MENNSTGVVIHRSVCVNFHVSVCLFFDMVFGTKIKHIRLRCVVEFFLSVARFLELLALHSTRRSQYEEDKTI